MTVSELIEHLKDYDGNEPVWFYHKLRGRIMPEEIIGPIGKTELTADGVLLSTSLTRAGENQ